MIHSPTHEKIALRAQEIWNRRGRPSGHDTAIWLEAEHQLTFDRPEPVAGHSHPGQEAVTSPVEIAANIAVQKSTARAPQQIHGKNAPPPAPPRSGKPLWDKPHSS